MTIPRPSGDEPGLGGQPTPGDDVRLGGEAALLYAIENLNHPVPKTRMRAVRVLAEAGDIRAFDLLADLLQRGDSKQRVQAARLLGQLRDPRGLDLLIQVANTQRSPLDLRTAAIRALASFLDLRTIPLLRNLLFSRELNRTSQPHTLLRQAAVETLQSLGDASLLDDLMKRAEKGNQFDALSLSFVRDAQLVPLLLERLNALRRTEPIIFGKARWIVQTLGTKGDQRAVEPFVDWLRIAFDAKQARLQNRIKRRGCLLSLWDMIIYRDATAPYPDWLIESLIEALGKLRSPEAVDVLIEIAGQTQGQDQRSVIYALSQIRDARVAAPIIEASSDASYHVRIGALAALSRVYHVSEAVLPAVLNALDDERPEVRLRAIEVLRQHREANAVPVLSRYLNDDLPQIRQAVERALRRIGTPEALAALSTSR
jgi:HEAT repeat protein